MEESFPGFIRLTRLLASACLLLSFCQSLASQTDDLAAKSRLAREAMVVGNFEEAAKRYAELVRALPEKPGLVMNLGLALHSAGRYREAIDQFQSVVKRQPDSTPAWLFLGLDFLKVSEPDKAVDPLEHVLRAEPDNQTARLELASALLSSGRPEAAIPHLQHLAERDPTNPKVWQGIGLSYVALSQHAFNELEKTAPESAYWDVLLANSLVSRNQYYSAFHLYKRALAKAPHPRAVYEGLAEVYRRTGHEDWATVEEDRERHLPAPDCATEVLECKFLDGRYPELLAIANGVRTPGSFFWQARACSQLSLQAFDRLTQMPPTAEIHELMAEAYRIRGKYDLAVQEWQEALKLASGNRRYLEGLARSLWLNREYSKAQPLLEKLVNKEPESAELNFELGDTLLWGEGPERSIPYLERAVRFSPGHLAAHASLGRAYIRLDQPEKAIPHLKAALSLDEEGNIYYQLSQAYKKVGESTLAQKTMGEFEEISKSARARRPQNVEEYVVTPP